MGIGHWDEVEKRRNERGQMAGSWSNLGTAAGSYRCGVHRIELGPGEMPTPAHVHGESEEIFYVLAGSGLTWMDGKADEIRAGDCIVLGGAGIAVGARGFRRRASTGHRSRPHLPRPRVGMTLIAWGTRDPNDICWYPRSKKIFWRGVGVIGRIEQLDYWDGEELE